MALLYYFKDENVCIKYLEDIRWPDQVGCPYCDVVGNHHITPRGYRCADVDCDMPFTVLTGTMLEESKLPLRTWFTAMFLFASHKNGISSMQLVRDLGISQKSAWYMLYRIRAACVLTYRMLSGIVQVDETYIGGKYKNRKPGSVPAKAQGRSPVQKAVVFGAVEQRKDGFLRAKVIVDASAEALQEVILEMISMNSKVVSDEWTGYKWLHPFYEHIKVNHKNYDMGNEGYTVNKIEGAWSHLKAIVSNLRGIDRKHLQRIVDQFCFMYNLRDYSPGVRFVVLLKNFFDKQLTMKTLKSDEPLIDNELGIALYEIETAIVKQHVLEIEYKADKKDKTIRAVEPIGIVVYKKAFHMIAWCHLRKGYRDFIVENIKVIADTEQAFTNSDLLTLKEYMRTVSKSRRLAA
jgi:transposase-like protein